VQVGLLLGQFGGRGVQVELAIGRAAGQIIDSVSGLGKQGGRHGTDGGERVPGLAWVFQFVFLND